jgi:ferritin
MESSFHALMREQLSSEFTASQQYLAMAAYADGADLPQLAAHFYRQSVEERNHALMFVKYMLDRDLPVSIPATGAVHNDFDSPVQAIEMALINEQRVTGEIEALFRAARAESDALGEQFMLWFLKDQVEEVSAMTTLLTIARRAGENLFNLEDFLARETVGERGTDSSAPAIAGGAL